MKNKPNELKTHSATRTVSKRRRAGMRRTKKDLHFRRRAKLHSVINNWVSGRTSPFDEEWNVACD